MYGVFNFKCIQFINLMHSVMIKVHKIQQILGRIDIIALVKIC